MIFPPPPPEKTTVRAWCYRLWLWLRAARLDVGPGLKITRTPTATIVSIAPPAKRTGLNLDHFFATLNITSLGDRFLSAAFVICYRGGSLAAILPASIEEGEVISIDDTNPDYPVVGDITVSDCALGTRDFSTSSDEQILPRAATMSNYAFE